jgi:hypothetical protein
VLEYTTAMMFVHAVRHRAQLVEQPASKFMLVPDAVFNELLADHVADRMLGVVGVEKVESEPDYMRNAETKHDDAIRHINRTRVSVQRPLDPCAAGWTTEDVFLEAYRLGWMP